MLHIRCEISLGKYQDQLLRLEDKLESGLYCELTDKTLHDGYIEYTLLYDMIANRITIDEVKAENGSLRLMKNLTWEYDALPHALICGGTGGGKTYFLLTIIEALLQTNAQLYILDPKNADLADLGTVMDNVYHTKEDMIECVNAFYEGMVARSEEMKLHPDYKTGENYAYLGLPPCFLIFDEYVAFLEMLGTKESISLLSQLKKSSCLADRRAISSLSPASVPTQSISATVSEITSTSVWAWDVSVSSATVCFSEAT